MPLEIERKFLLKCVPKDNGADAIIHIEQYYCSTKEEPDFRIRKSTSPMFRIEQKDVYTKTIKKRLSAGVYEENEITITEEEFNVYLKSAKSHISKMRYVKKVGKLKWEIDSYHNNIRLVVAEIELPDINHPIKIPNFISDNLIMEVTDFKPFSNKSLSQPFKPQK